MKQMKNIAATIGGLVIVALSFWITMTLIDYAKASKGLLEGFAGGLSPGWQNATIYVGAGVVASNPSIGISVPFGGTLRNIYVSSFNTPGPGQNYTCTIYVGGKATNLSVQLNGNSYTASNTTGTATVSSGDSIALRVDGTSAANNSNSIWWTVQIDSQ
jgi:hypothetical protein